MSYPPPRQPGLPTEPDEIEELEDDAIVAQQSAAHAPQPRVQVAMHEASIMVTDVPAEQDPSEVMATRQIAAMPRRGDPTMVLPRRAVVAAAPATRRPSWLPWVIWGVAGLLAFAFGGLLALLSARGQTRALPAAPSQTAPER